jgi:hypothetical protein
MRSKAKVSSKEKSIKNSASNTKILDPKEHPIELPKSGARKERKLAKNLDPNTKSLDNDSRSLEDVEVYNDLWMLKYDINEKGIGKIILPPSLSILLQSDRVSISPSAGGLFIRSI